MAPTQAGGRVGSNDDDMEDWTPENVVKLRDAKGKEWKLHLWRLRNGIPIVHHPYRTEVNRISPGSMDKQKEQR
jgi:hypothetical protein